MEKGKKEQKNPYRNEEVDVQKKVIEIAISKCFERGTGLMFKLFDIGNLTFEGNKLFVYKNNIGNIIRTFANGIRDGKDFDTAFNEMNQELEVVVRLACNDEEKSRIFMDKVNNELRAFRIFVDSLKGGEK